MSTEFSLSFSPCPNDCFMFDALVNHRLQGAPSFRVHMADIEALNLASMGKNGPDVTKISVAALPSVLENYKVLDAGAAMGFGTGPLLVSASPDAFSSASLAEKSIAVPGYHTTAYALLKNALGKTDKTSEVLFSAIEDAVVAGKFDLGVIIHESRFTYAAKGLHACMDLGAYWEKETGLPVPLGVIVVKRSLGDRTAEMLCSYLRKSVEFAFANPQASADYVAAHAQEMDAMVCRRHIELYVNEFSLSMGKEGAEAISRMMKLLGSDFHPSTDLVGA